MTVVLDVETKLGMVRSLELDVNVIGPGRPANRRGHPDTWTEAEGPSWGILGAFLIHRGRTRRLNADRIQRYLDRSWPFWQVEVDNSTLKHLHARHA